jgi:pyridoxamine 5'-phosphate oxidase
MSHDISAHRIEYDYAGLHETAANADPFQQFGLWFQQVLALNLNLANAMVVATVDRVGRPTARYVLLKEYSSAGFVFYTHALSQKGRQLAQNPHAALVFYWREMHRQIRIEGRVERLAAEKADSYFASRPRGSQISTWVAPQSQTLPDREYLYTRVEELSRQFDSRQIPRPEDWLGYRVVPDMIEFWQGQENRLHDRLVYHRSASGDWRMSRLAP